MEGIPSGSRAAPSQRCSTKAAAMRGCESPERPCRNARPLPPSGELPDRHPDRQAGQIAVAARVVEQDAARLDIRDLPAADHQHAAPIDAQRAVLGMDAEELRRGPAQAHGLGAVALDEVGTGLVNVRPSGGAEIAAGRGARTERTEGVAPRGGFGRKWIGCACGRKHDGCRLLAGRTA